MTVSSSTRKAGPFAGNGVVTTFPFAFKVFAKTDIKVIIVNSVGASTTLTLDSDYSVALNADQNNTPGGTVTYPISGTPLPTGYQLVELGNLPNDQETDLTNQGGFYPQTIEDMVDRATIQIQQIAETASRAIVVTESENTAPVLPPAAARAGTILGFDANGNVTTLPITASVGAGDMRDDVFVAGTDFTPGTTTTLNLSRAPSSIGNVWVDFDGTYQGRDQIQSLQGTVLTFTAPIPVGVQRVYVKNGTTLSINKPALGSVGPLELAPAYGTTAQRPVPLVIGQQYFDTTLGYEIVASSVVPPVWQNVSGSPPSSVNVLQFGADPTGVADSTAAFNAAVASCPSNAISVEFPPGTYYFATGPSIGMTSSQTNPATVAIRGAGSGVTKFKFANNGFAILYGTAYTSAHIEGISFLSPSAGGNYGLLLEQNGTFATGGFGAYGLTTLRDLEFRGDDGFNETHYWGTGLNVLGASNINCYDCTFYGPTGTPSGAGVNLGYAPNDHSIIPIVFNMMGCSFVHLQSGLIYGANWQGITVLYSNFTANFAGIIVPVGAVAPDQLLVNTCQFNNINASILFQVWCQAVSIMNSFFLVGDNSVGIAMTQMANTSIVGNIFSTADGTPTNQQAIQIGAYSQGAGVITGNQFNGLTTGVALLSGSQHVNVLGNCYNGNGTNVLDGGTGNSVGIATA